MKTLFAILLYLSSYVCHAQTTIYVAPAPKTYYERKREDADRALLYQMMLTEAAEKNLAKTREELAEYHRRSMARLEQVKRMYASYNKYPTSISNGWHKVVVTNNIEFCEERKVLVSNGLISEYVVDNWSPRRVSFSSPTKDGRAIIKITGSDGKETEYMDVYFIEAVINPSASTTAPQKPGTISFYSTYKKMSTVTFYIEGYEAGQLNQYFESGTPNCGQQGTLTLQMKPGTYSYRAENGRMTWNGTFTVSENLCTSQGIGGR